MGIGELENVLETEPFTAAPRVLQKALTPGAKDLKVEINRCTHCLAEEMDPKAALICTKGLAPKPGQWKKDKHLAWLIDPLRVIATAQDGEVLQNAVTTHKALIQHMQ